MALHFDDWNDVCTWCGLTDPEFTDEHACVQPPPV
jgi:hypothetical protein